MTEGLFMYLFGSPVTSRCILDKFITNYEWTPVATAANKRQLHATDTAGKRIPFQLPGQEMHHAGLSRGPGVHSGPQL